MKQYDPMQFVEVLSFTRYGGTAEEKRAAALIAETIADLGGKSEEMAFSIPASTYKSHVTRVTAPFTMELDTVPFGMCGAIPAPGKDLRFFYAAAGGERDYLGMGDDLSEYAVMVDQFFPETYERLCAKKAGAILVVMGRYYQNNEEAGMYRRKLRPHNLEHGVIPTFYINAKEATELVRNGAEQLHIELEQTDGETTSQNVLATIPGTDGAGESIVLTAHYDSLPICDGAWDNATGSAALMGLYAHFLKNPPKRTLRFIWTGSEEHGLLGAKAYVAQNEELLETICFCLNFDMCGTVLGSNTIKITGGKELEDFTEQFCREVGYSAKLSTGVHSSDSAPFADRGIPALGLSRYSQTTEIHTCRDTLFAIGADALAKNIRFAVQIAERLANAAILPVDRGMPDKIKEELDKYFQRTKTAK